MATFPLSVSADGRYLVDGNGAPFFVHADTAWSAMVQLNSSTLTTYVQHLIDKGFTAVLINLIEHFFADAAPNNQAGAGPFTTPDNYSTPNNAYFTFCDSVLTALKNAGIAALVAPSYVGFNGGSEGWMVPMRGNSAATLQGYGAYLGTRYASYDNIIWLHGGDYDVPASGDRDLVRAIKDGLKSTDMAGRLHTVHCNRGNSAWDQWSADTWLDLNTSYVATGAVYQTFAANRSQVQKPCFFIEGYYENDNSYTAQMLRRQSYWAVLSGLCGQFYGNTPVWKMSTGWDTGTGIGSTPYTHQKWVKKFTQLAPWWSCVPDTDDKLIVSGKGTLGSTDYVVAMRDANRRAAAAYIPTSVNPSVTVNLGQLTGLVTAQWMDPTSGAIAPIGTYSARGNQAFTAPGANAGGDNDWVLVLQSQQGRGGNVVF